MSRIVRRKGQCTCGSNSCNRRHTCVSCSTLALKFLEIVLDLSEGMWYSTNILAGDKGFEIRFQHQLEFFREDRDQRILSLVREAKLSSQSASVLNGGDQCPVQDSV